MDKSRGTISKASTVASEFLFGQIAGTAFALLLYFIEAIVLYRDAHQYLGVSLTSILAVYLLFGWIVGGVVGAATGTVCAVAGKGRSAGSRFCGTGSILGFIFTVLYLVRDLTLPQLRMFPASIMVSLAAAFFMWIGIAFLSRRMSARNKMTGRTRKQIRYTLALIALFSVIGSAGSSFMEAGRLPKRKPVSRSSPNIVLIVVDALRADHVSAYGYQRETTPHLDRIAGDGALFTNSYSHGNRTIYSMPALFTSLYPSFHGAIWFGEKMAPLAESKTTIAELCRDAGYTTVGLMSNICLKTPFGMTQGFDRLEEYNIFHYRLALYRVLENLGFVSQPKYRKSEVTPDATTISDGGIKWAKRLSDRPFFLFLHYMDVHHPYGVHDDPSARFKSQEPVMDPNSLFIKTAAMIRVPPPLNLPEAELRQLIDQYDSHIYYTDSEIGRFISAIEGLPADRETVVIFTSDHGDEFLEHGSLYHTNLVVEELIRVPLIIWRSKTSLEGKRIKYLVRHVDVLPTIADFIGVEPPAEAVGSSLIPLLRGADSSRSNYSIAEGDFCTSLNFEHWKLVHVDSTGTYELYDLSTDPWGLKDVSAEHPGQLGKMKVRLEKYFAEARKVKTEAEVPLSSETIRQLKALGYL